MSDASTEIGNLITSLGWTMLVQPRPPTKEEAKEKHQPLRFSCAILDKDGHLIVSTPYTCGSAFPERWFWEELSDFQRGELCRAAGGGAAPPHRKGFTSGPNQTIFERDLAQVIFARWKPAIVDVVGALACDCAHVGPYLPDAFEEWAADSGGNPDSIKEREAFYTMARNREALRRAMGARALEHLCKLGAEL